MASWQAMKKIIKHKESKKSHFVQNGVQVVIKDALPPEINLRSILDKAFNTVPSMYLGYIDVVYVGKFFLLDKNDFGAVYDQGAIYLNNFQASEEDAVSHLVHEIAHAVEQNNSSFFYSDGEIEREFLSKRQKVHSLLSAEGISVPLFHFYNTEYSKQFDSLLYDEIGYPMLAMLTTNIFNSPYAMTSINEYFANIFEVFYNKKDVNFVKNSSFAVYNKLIELEESSD